MINDTICAIATPLGSGGIGIVRVSGPQAQSIVEQLFRAANGTPAQQMETHKLYYGNIYNKEAALLDRGLCVLMRAPHSYTCEDVAEFQLHGGMGLLGMVLKACLGCGARLATPGEFTMRAFINGRLDLSQAEAVMDIIRAKTPLAVQDSADQLEGSLRNFIDQLEQQLVQLQADIVVGVDFPDDEDAAENEQVLQQLQCSAAQMEEKLAGAGEGRIRREGLRCVLCGSVNVGKSSLLNALLLSERAIVSDIPGTTRDVIEETLDLAGVPVVLVDTAGFRDENSADAVERIGIRRSSNMIEDAQLVLIVVDAGIGMDEETLRLLEDTAHKPRLLVINKTDLHPAEQLKQDLAQKLPEQDIICISAKQKQGLSELSSAMLRKAGLNMDAEASSSLIANSRHEQALRRALDSVNSAIDGLSFGMGADIVSIDIENALQALGEISGKRASDEVLHNVFSRFCLGK